MSNLVTYIAVINTMQSLLRQLQALRRPKFGLDTAQGLFGRGNVLPITARPHWRGPDCHLNLAKLTFLHVSLQLALKCAWPCTCKPVHLSLHGDWRLDLHQGGASNGDRLWCLSTPPAQVVYLQSQYIPVHTFHFVLPWTATADWLN